MEKWSARVSWTSFFPLDPFRNPMPGTHPGFGARVSGIYLQEILMSKATFTASTVFSLDDRDSGVDKAIGRLNTSRITASGLDAAKFHRRQALWLTNLDTGLSTMVFAMGGQVVTRDGIAIDYDSRHALGLRLHDKNAQIRVKPAHRIQVIRYFLGHPDMGHRLGIQLGALGAVLGFLSTVPMIVSAIQWMAG